MGNNVIIGRLKHEHHVDLLRTGQYTAQSVELDVHEYCCIKNYPLESFLDILETTTRHQNTWCWSIPDINAFIQECEQKMPKLVDGMEDLDYYFASMVLDHLPHILLAIKNDAKLDVGGRFSHYFISYDGY